MFRGRAQIAIRVAQAFQLFIALVICLGSVSRKMAHAGAEPGIPQQEAGWLQGWIQATVNWKQTAQNNPYTVVFCLAISPFILIFLVFMLPVFIILACALSTALVCFLTVCFFFACGLPVYFFTAASGFFFMMYVISRFESVVHCIQRLYVNIMVFPSKFLPRI